MYETEFIEVALAGRVSANSGLRTMMQIAAKEHGWNLYIPPLSYCTDNAAMIAMTGYLAVQRGGVGSLDDSPRPEWNS